MQEAITETNFPSADAGDYLVWRGSLCSKNLLAMLKQEQRRRQEALGSMDFEDAEAVTKAKGFQREIGILKSLESFLTKDSEEVQKMDKVEFTL